MLLAERAPAPVAAVTACAGTPPAPVRAAYALWTVAVGAGVLETVLQVGRLLARGHGAGPAVAAGLAVRLPVFAAALVTAGQLRRGRPWARTALALGLGVLGTASLLVGPVEAVAHGRTLAAAVTTAGPVDLLFGACRGVHLAAVPAAVATMFLPAANAWFRAGNPTAAADGHGAGPAPTVGP